ncbi:MAG: carboxymuconolactone decarboxylase family protein [Acidobacteriaceae bacterium]
MRSGFEQRLSRSVVVCGCRRKGIEMSLDALIDTLPSYAKDLKLNYSSLVKQNMELTPQQLWGTVAAVAIAVRSEQLTQASLAAAAANLSAQELEAAKTAAALMGMNNIFYRFHHLSSNEKYGTMPARLRMNGLRGHGMDEKIFELWCLAVSAVNGCSKCVDSHEKILLSKGVTEETIAAVIRVTSVLHAIGAVLDAERVTAPAVV